MAGLDFPWPFPDPPTRAWEYYGVLCAVRLLGPPDWIAEYVRLADGHPWVSSPDHAVPFDVHIENTDQAGWIRFDTMSINQPSVRSRKPATWTVKRPSRRLSIWPNTLRQHGS